MRDMQEQISAFDMLNIGIGPSSSHTLGPWRAARVWVESLRENIALSNITKVHVKLYGSLAYTGKGHATDLAVLMGLLDKDPITVEVASVPKYLEEVKALKELLFGGEQLIAFQFDVDIEFDRSFLDYHPNGMEFIAYAGSSIISQEQYFSIGGGFIRQENQAIEHDKRSFPYPSSTAIGLLEHCHQQRMSIYDIVYKNERSIRSEVAINNEVAAIWGVMLDSMYEGCHTEGILPGGLNVKRRAFDIHKKLASGGSSYDSPQTWLEAVRTYDVNFKDVFKWISCFALAVNEVNASLGRIVTAPTNGSAGVIPSVLMYYMCFENKQAGYREVKRFLIIAGEIGTLFKKGATISAALGGCQAEIGVSSAMAAGALTALLGGSNEQILNAAEIAMEHHLGLTCDPIGGLVQVPCIERNSMGAVKAINAAELALETHPEDIKVPLDKVIESMWNTAKDMNSKYKETSQGGLAIAVNLPEC